MSTGHDDGAHDDRDHDVRMYTKDDALWSLLVRRTGAEGLTEEEIVQLAARVDADAEVARVVRATERIAAASADLPEHEPVTEGATAAALDRVRARMRRPVRVLRLHPASAPPRRRRSRAWMGLAAGILATAAAGTAVWRIQVAPHAASVALAERATDAGERIELRLADGSHVVLGPQSRLSYPERFAGPERAVVLEGEGFFTVAHDPAHPFIVRSGGAATQAVGTAFAVRAYPGEGRVSVVVAEGRVVMRPAGAPADSTGTYLGIGDRGVLDGAGRVAVEQGVDVGRAIDWTKGRLSYHRASVRDVVRDMERWYDLDITVTDSAIARDRVTVTFDHALADDALRRLATVLGARLQRDGRSVLLLP